MIESISKKLIGYRVKAARESANLNQNELTKALGLKDRQTISDIENGKRALKPDELVKLTEVLDKDIEFFPVSKKSHRERLEKFMEEHA